MAISRGSALIGGAVAVALVAIGLRMRGSDPKAAALAEAVPAAPAPQPAAGEPSLDAVRQATEKFQDVNVALKEGYIRDPMNVCETADMVGRSPDLGAMGIHYFRPDLLGITGPPNPKVSGNGIHTDFLQPAVLLYEPQEDGSVVLVGVENLAFEASWKAAGNTQPPSYYGVPYDYMVDDPATTVDEAHHFVDHYDRHVWIYRTNPSGDFAPFNPAVSCAHHKGGSHEHSSPG